MIKMSEGFPIARKEGLLVEKLSDEVLVYDLDRKKAHCLNQTAALIWNHCDGKTSVEEIARILCAHLRAPIDKEVVWYGLDYLGKTRLLEEPVARPGGMLNVSRRDLIRKIGLAVSVPLVISVLAPKASAAHSCMGASCTPILNDCSSPCHCNPQGTCVG
jgi:Coenzyme PQQ synthesis protein D (PqqD)